MKNKLIFFFIISCIGMISLGIHLLWILYTDDSQIFISSSDFFCEL